MAKGARDLIHDKADVLASTANFLKNYGWRRGATLGRGHGQYGGYSRLEQIDRSTPRRLHILPNSWPTPKHVNAIDARI